MRELGCRAGVDIGGTFTDIVLELGDRQHSLKLLTTTDAPEEAILEGLQKAADEAGVRLSDIQSIIHGTTLATNALIERRGAKTALITTEGFRDVIEMRTESRFEQYDLNLVLPKPLIERRHRLTVHERIGAQGQILRPLRDDDVEKVIWIVHKRSYESVAIGFLHSYLNDTHERRLRDALTTAMPDLIISISSEVSPQMREYERFNTVAANAYVKPVMAAYLKRLEEKLKAIGVTAPVYLMHSGGGIIGLESARDYPVRLVESGPAGGAIFASHIAARHGLNRALSFDMGGTTAKICLIRNHEPKTARSFEVARTYRFKKGSGMPISIPVIDMVEIGAGGGSIAHLDAMRQIRVGPESAGSMPGPACYDRGGSEPAITDADLLLGRLDPDDFANGTIPLKQTNAKAAINKAIAEPLQLSLRDAAFAVGEVVDENMANAARMHSVENGEDLSNYTMIAFGGAAPLHAARMCEKLGIARVLIPPGAGVGSAIGFLRAPFSFETTRSIVMKHSEFNSERVRSLIDEMKREAAEFVRTCDIRSGIETQAKAFMRYIGQGWEIPVDLPEPLIGNPTAEGFQAQFERAYEVLFGRIVQGLDIEITSWAVKAGTIREAVEQLDRPAATGAATAGGKRDLFDVATRDITEAGVIERGSMRPGQSVSGSAIITEAETSIVVSTGFEAFMLADGTIELTRRRQGSNP